MTRCLDCGCRTTGSRCPTCRSRRDHARNKQPAQQARLAITRQQRRRVYARDGYRCIDCGTAEDLTLDHIVPLAVKAKRHYRDDELVTRCRSCNSSRGCAHTRVPQALAEPARAAENGLVHGGVG